ncbi:hypothetical protein ACFC5Z_39650 [Streptomyces sp. NPDC056004]|uniref:hypothetical protein n=1 Tax=Streptomyces sp. NPDC056004 TaxID=3345677 RepID=UPI0035DB5F24
MSKRTTARRESGKTGEELRTDVEFRARGFHISMDRVPWTALALLAGAVAARVAGADVWML